MDGARQTLSDGERQILHVFFHMQIPGCMCMCVCMVHKTRKRGESLKGMLVGGTNRVLDYVHNERRELLQGRAWAWGREVNRSEEFVKMLR